VFTLAYAQPIMTDLSDESAFADGEEDSGEEFGDFDEESGEEFGDFDEESGEELGDMEEESGDELGDFDEESDHDPGDVEEESGEGTALVQRRRRPIQTDFSDKSGLTDLERDSDVEGGARPVIAHIVGGKVQLRKLMILVCVNKAVRANFQNSLKERFRRENAPTQMARWCSRENWLRPRPLLNLDLSAWCYDLDREFTRFNFTVNCLMLVVNVPESPMADFNLTVRFADRGRYCHRRDNFIYVIVNDAHFLYRSMRFVNSRDQIPQHVGEGEDPQPRVGTRLNLLVYLTLNGREWLGETTSGIRGVERGTHCEYRFYNTPNGVELALNFAQDVVRAATGAVAPRPEVGDGGAA
jgi:hypothetical protein